ncbi:MAG: VPS10 domain-containing protein [Bacteroidota bacterium]
MKKLFTLVGVYCLVIAASVHFLKEDQGRFSSPEKEKRTNAASAKKETDKPGMFLEFHRGIRTSADQTAPAYHDGYKWNELKLAKRHSQWARSRSGRTKSNGISQWTEHGPGNVPGRTRALYNIPGDANNNTWLAGAATGGIWRTTDGGATWTEKSIDLPGGLPISSFAANSSGTVIYAGTGEYVSSVFSASGNGILKSIDKGLSWTALSTTKDNANFPIVTRVICNPADPNIIVATTVQSSISSNNTSAIMRSIDGGANWTKAEEINGAFEQVIASPNNFNIQYASQNGVGVWKSTDAGATWNLSNTGMSPNGRVEISVSRVNSNKLFASAEGTLSGKNSDLYFSSNAGASWSLVDVQFNSAVVDFFEGQGFYDNVVMCDPFDENIVYFGGVSLFRSNITSGSSNVDDYSLEEDDTQSFLFLHSFANIPFDNQRLDTGTPNPQFDVEIRFGAGISQKAHQFLIPANKTNGVPVNEYAYTDYVTVPFQAWDVTNNRQLMVSFRDQNRNGAFDLLAQHLTTDGADYLTNSREYLYIHDIAYNPLAPNANVAQNGGHEQNMAYNIFPALANGAVWPGDIVTSKLVINHSQIAKLNANTVTVADGRGSFDNKNPSDQINLNAGVHPDHHSMIPIIVNETAKTYSLLIGNDGGIFQSKVSTTPGITAGDWTFKGSGYNTSQFYGADKKPGADEFIGGMQDNGTRISPSGQAATATSNYSYAIGGDGFEVIWNSKNKNKIMGSIYNGQIYRSLNGGTSWQAASSGLSPGDNFPFVTKLANSRDFPDRVFTVSTAGVHVSNNFGESWNTVSIPQNFVIGSPFFLDVEVSRADPNIIWAGSGMNNTVNLRHLFVSSNGGQTFSQTNNYAVTTLGSITKLASHPTQKSTAYALFSFADKPKILRTTDLGASWQDISGFGAGSSSTNGFPDVAVYCLYVRPDNPDIIWAGTEIGIVESLDNGATWTLLEDFPNVSVWDLKGQDNKIVIATHGRGIWTATVDETQNVVKTPTLAASGTSPQKKLMIRLQALESFDSLQVFVGNTLTKTVKVIAPGMYDVDLGTATAGSKEIKILSFRGTSPFMSETYTVNQLDILETKNSYSTYFGATSDLFLDGLSLQSFSGTPVNQRRTLHSNHNYAVNKTYQMLIRTPITVSNTLPTMFYEDIAIIEPGAGKDSVVVEATKNGLDWIAIGSAHNASSNSAWLSAYNSAQAGSNTMFMRHELNIASKFAAGDLLLFRLRMASGPAVTAWGWAINFVSIQEQPVGVAESKSSKTPISAFPNPSTGSFTIEYELTKPSKVQLQIIDAFGRNVNSSELGQRKAGVQKEVIDLDRQQPGTYMVILHTPEGKQVGKVSIVR